MSRHCYLDTETTGLSARKHEIIEIAIITEYDDGRIERWESKIKPRRIEAAHPKALEINGYSPDTWADAPDLDEVAETIAMKLKGATVVGHNIAFDIKFIEAALAESKIDQKVNHRATIDTITLVREHLLPTGLKSASLDNTRRWLGWSLDGAHTALQDAEDCMRLRHTLERSTRFQRFVWSLRGPRNMERARR